MGKLCRNDVFIVTKLPPVAVNPVLVEEYLTKSLVNLRMDFVDLYLIHTPFSFKLNDNKDLHPFQRNGEIDFDPKTDLVAVWKVIFDNFYLIIYLKNCYFLTIFEKKNLIKNCTNLWCCNYHFPFSMEFVYCYFYRVTSFCVICLFNF